MGRVAVGTGTAITLHLRYARGTGSCRRAFADAVEFAKG